MEPQRALEKSLWRTALALSGDAPRADGALGGVVRNFPRPQGAGESRLLAAIVASAAPEALSDEREAARAAALLVHVAGQDAGTVAAALGRSRAWVLALPEPPDAGSKREAVASADADAALARVDHATEGVRRGRSRLNALKLGLFFVCVGLLIYVLFDLRAAADRERERRTPADLLSVPLTPADKRPPTSPPAP